MIQEKLFPEATDINSNKSPGGNEKELQVENDLRFCNYKQFLGCIVKAYDSAVIRAYCKVRFTIININILHILALCLRGKRKILDVGCGFGLFGCYFSALYPDTLYYGYDSNLKRIQLAQKAASRLGLTNAHFRCLDARDLSLHDRYDAIMMIDLLHHIDDESKRKLLGTCAQHLVRDGRLIIKDVTTHPKLELGFTWLLDVMMTRSFDMWYWGEERFQKELRKHFNRVDTFPIADWLPYPHVVYLSENVSVNRSSISGSAAPDIF